MKSYIKYALVGAALAASGGAYADAVLPNTGNGQAVLFVKNNTTSTVYARAFNLFADNIVTQSQITADTYTGGIPLSSADTSFSFSFGPLNPDANLTSFLNGTDSFSYTVLVGDSLSATGQGLKVGERRFFFANELGGNAPSNSQVNSSYTQLNSWLGTLNSALSGAAGSDSSVSSGGVWGTTGGSQDWAGAGPSTVVTLGDTAGFYLVTSNGTAANDTGSTARIYNLGNVTLSAAGVLTFAALTGGPEVPLPPAIWLLGSALAGFAGIRRRRENAAA
jgi:hypothetical protein